MNEFLKCILKVLLLHILYEFILHTFHNYYYEPYDMTRPYIYTNFNKKIFICKFFIVPSILHIFLVRSSNMCFTNKEFYLSFIKKHYCITITVTLLFTHSLMICFYVLFNFISFHNHSKQCKIVLSLLIMYSANLCLNKNTSFKIVCYFQSQTGL